MAFFEHRISTRFSFGATGGPVWSTRVKRSQGGHRFVNREWEFPLHRFNLTKSIETNEDFEEIRAFFFNVFGMYDGFRFRDAADYLATQANTNLEFITGSTWQLQRKYTVGGRTYYRDIYKPCVSPSIVVYRTRTGSVTTASASVATTTGVATISGHMSGDTYTWTGEFDVPVAFTSDAMQAEITSRQGNGDYLMSWPNLELEEIRI